MAIKATFIRRMLWKVKCRGPDFPPAFWFGFWFVAGANSAFIVIGWAEHVGQLITDLIFP